ncbi:MAG: hypothetical protein H8M99_01530 [Gloeobacteraceae cyanobacterium ES-bin-144]|nr:hypothetical protein [Verrucomicrobiales bacterium]
MALSNEIPAPPKPLMAGCQQEPCSASSCGCEKCENYQKYLAWKKRENASDGINELVEENRHLKEQLATLSITHAKARQRLDELLSDYVRDKRIIGEALGLTGENVMIHWFQLRAIHSLQNEQSPSVGANDKPMP